MATQCSHLEVPQHQEARCEAYLKMGDTWFHLRLCMICGQVGCCDDSKNQHATKHVHEAKHPLIRSIEPGEAWVWCYADDMIAGELES